MRHPTCVLVLGALALCAGASAASIRSSFTTGTEGWTADGDGANPIWVAAGGVDGGFFQVTDGGSGSIWHFRAPEPFLGDVSRAYGQSLSYWLKQSATDSPATDRPDVVLSGAGLTLVLETAPNPGTTWTHYTVTLDESAPWHKDTPTGPAPTQAEFRSVMADLTDLRIRGEFRSGADVGGLDEVEMGLSAPLPGSLPVESRFDTDTEGWRLRGDVQHGSTLPIWVSTGGNPGGCLEAVDDATGNWWYWLAPPKFGGDLSAAYGGALQYDLRTTQTDAIAFPPTVVLTGAAGVLSYSVPTPPQAAWITFRVPLSAGDRWVDAAGSPASEAAIRAVLADVLALRILGEYHSGADTGHLDNVRISAPSTLPGDANNDGVLNAFDAMAMLAIAGGLTPATSLVTADVAPKPSAAPLGYGDGRVTALDATRLMRHLAGLDPAWP